MALEQEELERQLSIYAKQGNWSKYHQVQKQLLDNFGDNQDYSKDDRATNRIKEKQEIGPR
jgi:hypothetical protein